MSAGPKTITVFGVDPAPSKGLCVCRCELDRDGCKLTGTEPEYSHVKTGELNAFAVSVGEQQEKGAVLIVWDAPLHPPRFYARTIEIISRQYCLENHPDVGRVARNGRPSTKVSIQPAATCSHWAITQKVLGYPSFSGTRFPASILGDWDMEFLDGRTWEALREEEKVNQTIHLVETHPILAIAIKGGTDAWYRDNVANAQEYLRSMSESWVSEEHFTPRPHEPLGDLKRDDLVDSWVAMILGVLWVRAKAAEFFVPGKEDEGSFLLPYNKELWSRARDT